MRSHLFVVVFLLGSIFSFNAVADGWDPTSKAPNDASIVNTRHNLTMSYLDTTIMDIFRNNYTEVCVYCHTPHAANTQVLLAPLWNRTINTSEYTVYDKPRTLNQPIGQPGPNSLTCLSCHDGTIAVDSIINMPGSGRYNQNQETDSQVAFLNTWSEVSGVTSNHLALGSPDGGIGCLICHGPSGAIGPDFTAFALGTDLTDDHPIGILYPDEFGPGFDFAEPDVIITGRLSFFDLNGDGFPNSNDVRLYDTGDGPEVECASCHDPHGVPSGSKGTRFNPSFLRVNNGIVDNGSTGTAGIVSAEPSALCLTCHTK